MVKAKRGIKYAALAIAAVLMLSLLYACGAKEEKPTYPTVGSGDEQILTTNGTEYDITSLSMKSSTESEYGNDLLAMSDVIAPSETFCLEYEGVGDDVSYDIQFTLSDGNQYTIYALDLPNYSEQTIVISDGIAYTDYVTVDGVEGDTMAAQNEKKEAADAAAAAEAKAKAEAEEAARQQAEAEAAAAEAAAAEEEEQTSSPTESTSNTGSSTTNNTSTNSGTSTNTGTSTSSGNSGSTGGSTSSGSGGGSSTSSQEEDRCVDDVILR